MTRRAPSWLRAGLFGALCLGATACGTDRALTGVWQQVCEGDASACADAPFVYKLHLGRFGDDLTGLVARYAKSGPAASFDTLRECGCYLVTSGSARALTTRFQIEPGMPSALGCPAVGHAFSAPGCKEAIANPPCQTVQFELDGESDTLVGNMKCDDAPSVTVRFEPVNERLRRTCVGACRNAPDTGSSE